LDRELADLVDASIPDVYKPHVIESAHAFGDTCFVFRSSSKTCGNKDLQRHANNTVYFVALKRGVMYQRCYCRKDVVREGGVACADYASDAWPIPKKLVDALWPPDPPARAAMLRLLDATRPPLRKKKRT